MTGYGSAERDGLRIEIRSVNGRYLELKIRQPFGGEVEARLRKRLERVFGRGRVDVSVAYESPAGGELGSLGIDADQIARLAQAMDELAEVQPQLTAPNQLEVLDFLMRRASP
jgi:uncharacterized protein YicC (UPF0701 family)